MLRVLLQGSWVGADGKVTKRWKLVGECHVHSVMDGKHLRKDFLESMRLLRYFSEHAKSASRLWFVEGI
jgi:hypothetical protein